MEVITTATDALRFLNLSAKEATRISTFQNILDKPSGTAIYISYMLSRTNEMFTYTSLPETIPPQLLELMLQTYGSLGIVQLTESETSNDPGIYALRGDAGGPPDPYYQPTLFISANPALMNTTYNFRIVNHYPPFDRTAWSKYPPAVLMRNDINCDGLLPLFARYAAQMVENDISIRSAQINSRQQTLICAASGPEIESANKYIADLEAGKLSAVATRPFLEGIEAQNVSTMASNAIIQLIELQQYLKASWYNELGLNSNFNMKREYLSAEEIQASTDILLPLVDDMLTCRKNAVEAINKTFGTNITVSKNSAWENKQKETDQEDKSSDSLDSTEEGETSVQSD